MKLCYYKDDSFHSAFAYNHMQEDGLFVTPNLNNDIRAFLICMVESIEGVCIRNT